MLQKNSEKQQFQESQTVIESDLVYQGKVISVRKDEFYDPIQNKQQYDIVLHPGAVAILPLDDEGNIYLVKQWRRATSSILLEIPAGVLERGETPLECARRELQEEIGFFPRKLTPLGGIFTAPGFCNEYIHLFLAEDLIPQSLQAEDSDYIDIIKLPLDEVLQSLEQGIIQDAKTLSGILIYLRYKNRFVTRSLCQSPSPEGEGLERN